MQKAKDEIEQLKQEAKQLERAGNFTEVAEIQYGKIPAAQEKLTDFNQQLIDLKGKGSKLVKEEVSSEDIAEIVARWTGIPVTKMLQSEREKLLTLEEELSQRVVGQAPALEAIADAIRRNRTGLSDDKKPIGSFLFLGSTGVGKTELAKALAEFLFDDENMMTRIDMSEYQERHAVARLVGAPPGYVGYDEGGQLTEAVRRKPYSVILLDEIEKAHPDVFNILLQVLDDGRLTDNKGRVANFKNSIIIMTSNMGAELIQQNFARLDGTNDAAIFEKTEGLVFDLLKQSLRPEFLNRIDEIVMFQPLNNEHIRQIVELQLKGLEGVLAKQGITLIATSQAINYITGEGYDPQFGARPVKRIIQKKVLNALSKAILKQEVQPNAKVVLDSFGSELVFRQPTDKDKEEENN